MDQLPSLLTTVLQTLVPETEFSARQGCNSNPLEVGTTHHCVSCSWSPLVMTGVRVPGLWSVRAESRHGGGGRQEAETGAGGGGGPVQ